MTKSSKMITHKLEREEMMESVNLCERVSCERVKVCECHRVKSAQSTENHLPNFRVSTAG